MPRPRDFAGRALLAVAVLLLLLRASSGEARVVQTPPPPPDPAARGGVPLPQATPPAASRGAEYGLGLPSAQLAWMMLAQMEVLTQISAASRLAIGDGHGAWRPPRVFVQRFPARRFVAGKRRSGPLLPP